NMRADMAAMAIASPILRRTGALWDPYEQPMGPRSVIDVRDPQELTQMVMRDVPQSLNVWKQDIRADIDRAIGMNDTALRVDSGGHAGRAVLGQAEGQRRERGSPAAAGRLQPVPDGARRDRQGVPDARGGA